MNQTELNKYRAVLEAKKADLSAGLRNREDIAIEKTPDALDEVQLAGERELAIRNLDRESNLLRNVRTRAGSNPRRQLWRLHALRRRHQAKAAGSGAVGEVLHPVPGSGRSPRVRSRNRRRGRAAAQRSLRFSAKIRGRGQIPAPFVYLSPKCYSCVEHRGGLRASVFCRALLIRLP